MRHFFSIALLLLLWTYTGANAWADDVPGDSRIKLLKYDETDVYTITTRYGYQTSIVFAPNEDIETISVGDRSVWQIIPGGNRLFIRPMDEDVTTNMTILTNKHSYQFDLKSLSAEQTKGNIYVAKFIYPDEKKITTPFVIPKSAAPAAADAVQAPFESSPSAAPVQAEAATAPNEPPAHNASSNNYHYTYAGTDDLAPLQVYDDGNVTYIKYHPGPMPKLFIVGSDGSVRPTHYTVEGPYLLVGTVAAEIVMTSGDSTVHVYNETLNPR